MSEQMKVVMAIAGLVSWLMDKPMPTHFVWDKNKLHRFGRGGQLWLLKEN